MNAIQITLLLLAALSIVIMGVIYYKTKKPLRMFITSAVIRAAGFTLVNLLAGQTGVYLAINAGTIGCTAVLGLPGVISLLMIKLIWIV